MTMEDETGVLEVDNGSEAPGIEILVGCRVVLRWENGEARVEVTFKGVYRGGADAAASQCPT
jgi:hypothetical protein